MPHHPVKKKIIRRPAAHTSTPLADLPPLLGRIYAARKLDDPQQLDRSLSQLPPPWLLTGMDAMAERLARAIARQESLLVVADYDADGATACAVAVRGLKALGLERVSYLVPNRFEYGYGLTPEIVALAAPRRPDILLTVDNGISALEGAEAAQAHGMELLITDHHTPGAELPAAAAIVNPNLPGDAFPSRCLAGVGVMFYVLMALRQRLRENGHFTRGGRPEPNLAQWLDLVALGTVADVVPLDHVNRILVHQGLRRIGSGQASPGILALLEVAGRKPKQISAADLGFSVGPRLNAAGRLDDMSLGIECLLADHPSTALGMAARLDRMNKERRELEDQMKQEALAYLDALDVPLGDKAAICLYDAAWHQGVIGLVASRVKDLANRPVVVFAAAGDDLAKGSVRSIPGIHIRDLLSDINTQHPGLIRQFGGHAMAAGLSLGLEDLPRFMALFEQEAGLRLDRADLEHAVHSDGGLEPYELDLAMAEQLRQAGPWGHGFPEPLFDGEFEVAQRRVLGDKHLKLVLRPVGGGREIDAIAFGLADPGAWLDCRTLRAAYRLDVNEFRDHRIAQLRIEYMESGDD
ncbi:single-stranded-DNA-specific exonuclease RecJ [Methylomagnum ishizawai]|uniref:single-stranded-DNA-specific exonuclease RecJ n=1 Tax=Methylomagnum ishizawai TaxID=1760988 RepID=UPI001C333988|nr:single-stranded-DNA-specific exonuclease RecJ [Methylomagnum ishizawai]BBL76717.1 single-stranded-DNA-specific exonuclease RecJ [Methylomagnum ishizawai]